MIDFDELVRRVIWQESRGKPDAVSPVGAIGLMQIMPDTAKSPGFGLAPIAHKDLWDPEKNKAFGTKYLQKMLDRYGGDTTRALVAYNWGPGNADEWDGNTASLPAETRDYVAKITKGKIPAFPMPKRRAQENLSFPKQETKTPDIAELLERHERESKLEKLAAINALTQQQAPRQPPMETGQNPTFDFQRTRTTELKEILDLLNQFRGRV